MFLCHSLPTWVFTQQSHAHIKCDQRYQFCRAVRNARLWMHRYHILWHRDMQKLLSFSVKLSQYRVVSYVDAHNHIKTRLSVTREATLFTRFTLYMVAVWQIVCKKKKIKIRSNFGFWQKPNCTSLLKESRSMANTTTWLYVLFCPPSDKSAWAQSDERNDALALRIATWELRSICSHPTIYNFPRFYMLASLRIICAPQFAVLAGGAAL